MGQTLQLTGNCYKVDVASILPVGYLDNPSAGFSCRYHPDLRKVFILCLCRNGVGNLDARVYTFDGSNFTDITTQFPKFSNVLSAALGLQTTTYVTPNNCVSYNPITHNMYIGVNNKSSTHAGYLYKIDQNGVITDMLLDGLTPGVTDPIIDLITGIADEPTGTVCVTAVSESADVKKIFFRTAAGVWSDISPNTSFTLEGVVWFPDIPAYVALGHGGSWATITTAGVATDKGVGLLTYTAGASQYYYKSPNAATGSVYFAQTGHATDGSSTGGLFALSSALVLSAQLATIRPDDSMVTVEPNRGIIVGVFGASVGLAGPVFPQSFNVYEVDGPTSTPVKATDISNQANNSANGFGRPPMYSDSFLAQNLDTSTIPNIATGAAIWVEDGSDLVLAAFDGTAGMLFGIGIYADYQTAFAANRSVWHDACHALGAVGAGSGLMFVWWTYTVV